jgi:hypothetical protein
VLAHCRAGAIAAGEVGADSLIASDVIKALPRVLGERRTAGPGSGPHG